MNSNHSNQNPSVNGKSDAPQQAVTRHEAQDDRFPGTFFRIPGVPQPGKTTWSLVK
ncbi:MAG: hypothetical protein PHW13_03535 [Methylococcales bacterium]|nr:hypothetical protein [Methylococcales bacterium]